MKLTGAAERATTGVYLDTCATSCYTVPYLTIPLRDHTCCRCSATRRHALGCPQFLAQTNWRTQLQARSPRPSGKSEDMCAGDGQCSGTVSDDMNHWITPPSDALVCSERPPAGERAARGPKTQPGNQKPPNGSLRLETHFCYHL